MTAEDVLILIKIHNNNNHNCSLALYPGPPGRAGTITPRTTQVSWHQNSQDQPGELAPKLPGPPRRAGTRIPRTSQASWYQNSQDHPGELAPQLPRPPRRQNSQDHPGELAPELPGPPRRAGTSTLRNINHIPPSLSSNSLQALQTKPPSLPFYL